MQAVASFGIAGAGCAPLRHRAPLRCSKARGSRAAPSAAAASGEAEVKQLGTAKLPPGIDEEAGPYSYNSALVPGIPSSRQV